MLPHTAPGKDAVAWHQRLSIGARLGLGFGLVCLLIVLMAGNAAWQAQNMQRQFAQALDNRVPVLTLLQTLSREVSSVNLAARDSVLADDAAIAQTALARIESGRGRIGDVLEQIQQRLDGADKALGEELGNHSSGVLVTLLKFSRLQRANQREPAKALLFSVLVPKMDEFAKGIDKAQEAELKALQASRDRSAAYARWSHTVTAAMSAVVLLLSILMAWRITRSITRPVNETVHVAEAIARGDLTVVLPAGRHDEVGRLRDAVHGMQQQLRDLVGNIAQLADQLAGTSGEIAEGSADLSQRTEAAAASLQQTAGSLVQLAQTVQHSAAAASNANQMVSAAAVTAERGGRAVFEVIERMGEISKASGQIADIIGVIDGIAFQTNILALNAAVEAARAGVHGKGFAVVASEVRALAQRSTQAAREIKVIIGSNADTVASGERLVRDAGSTMREIVDGVTRATAIVDDICRSAGTQNHGLGEVNASVSRLDEMTQRNAALVQQSAASAEGLRDQARSLQSLIKRFTLAA